MLGWLLRGRAHLNPGEFRNRNHKQVFINSFVILDLLQPMVFEDSQVGGGTASPIPNPLPQVTVTVSICGTFPDMTEVS